MALAVTQKRDQPKKRRRKAGQNERSHREGHDGWAGRVKTFRALAMLKTTPPGCTVVYGQNVQQDLGRAKQVSDERYADLKDAAARRTQLGIQRPKLRETLRRWLKRRTSA
jgi:hypothetical protein